MADEIRKQLGGDRLGSGGKMNVYLHNFGRSTHDLGRIWKSSMAPGVLTPCFVEPVLNADTFDLDPMAIIKTIPVIRPIYGSFKFQMDFFVCPMRLYSQALHNNKLKIGMDMSKVVLPKIEITGPDARLLTEEQIATQDPNTKQIHPSSITAYLGIRGLGRAKTPQAPVTRKFCGLPHLMYWDIFKNYYANKQEENAYVLGNEGKTIPMNVVPRTIKTTGSTVTGPDNINSDGTPQIATFYIKSGDLITITGTNVYARAIELVIQPGTGGEQQTVDLLDIMTPQVDFADTTSGTMNATYDGYKIVKILGKENVTQFSEELSLVSFPLSNIDDMRDNILSNATIEITSSSLVPYSTPLQRIDSGGNFESGTCATALPLNGLAVKTYLSDRFNNWLSTEWIDGVNGIAQMTAVDTSSGSFTMDSLNFAQKFYDLKNRIAVSGGSYYDWQEAVYGEVARRHAESPMYQGGFSSEITFGEVVSTAAAGDEPLGSLAGKGHMKENGETIVIRVEEPSYIIGIASITPRIDYSQGNKWFTEIETMDDWHKPTLDGIGFQELITEEMAAWDTIVDGETVKKFSAGKQPAWIEYMTAVNENYGDFAIKNNLMSMTLSRNYEFDLMESMDENSCIKDLTTYIDPTKFNYAFADTSLTAQNFWVLIGIDCKARRKMSAKIMPNM